MSKPKRPSASRMPILSRISLCVTAAITPFSVVAQQAPAPKASEEQRVQRSDADKVDELVVARTTARTNKDYARSDELRNELLAMGIVVNDGVQGTTWEVQK